MKCAIQRRTVVMIVLLIIFSVQSLLSISRNSATFDEVQNFGIGKYLLTEHKWDVMGSITHPPVGFYLASLPLLLSQDQKQLWEYEGVDRNNILFLGAVDVYRGQGLLSAKENGDDRLLMLSRAMILAVSLALGYYIYRLSTDLYGHSGGLLSLTVFTFCPNFLAFSGIATQDAPLAVFWFIASYYFWTFLQGMNSKNAVLTGLFLGLAVATKFTAFLLIPLQIGLYLMYCWKEHQKPTAIVLIIYAVAAFVFSASYGFDLTPFFQGYELLKLEMDAGQAAFFKGELSNTGWWNFYPTVLLLKTPLSILILFAAATVYHVKRISEMWFPLLFLLVPMLTILIVCSCSNFAIGTRYLLPIYPLMYVSLGQLAEAGGKARIVICLLLCWLVAATITVAPHYLAYFNESVGGPSNGYKYFVDSNLDWGQGLKDLKKYMDCHSIDRVSLSYFGADSPGRYGINYDWLPSHHLANPNPDEPYNFHANRYLAISATNLQGVYLQNPEEFKWLRQKQPVTQIGYSIFIYDLGRQ